MNRRWRRAMWLKRGNQERNSMMDRGRKVWGKRN